MAQDDTVLHLRRSFREGRTRPMQFRISQLEALNRFLEEKKSQILESLKKDLNKPPFEAELSELSLVKSEINLALNNLSSWMKDEYVSKNWVSPRIRTSPRVHPRVQYLSHQCTPRDI
ncbi:aldehyde dehydrogenase family 3 member B1-like [Hyla sarda]|uniref:aldehyde dehydrogenase family 3 member B1-like n=1 Tax=Hyla sarda TaxID=327740 RepID=UPI0024C42992|nr:aldehyde dehydrogenase family 3 member B1-like [Hyla sarda]